MSLCPVVIVIDRDPISPRVRIVEAKTQLTRARSALSKDDELTDRLDEILREIDTVNERLNAKRDDSTHRGVSGDRR